MKIIVPLIFLKLPSIHTASISARGIFTQVPSEVGSEVPTQVPSQVQSQVPSQVPSWEVICNTVFPLEISSVDRISAKQCRQMCENPNFLQEGWECVVYEYKRNSLESLCTLFTAVGLRRRNRRRKLSMPFKKFCTTPKHRDHRKLMCIKEGKSIIRFIKEKTMS